MLRSIWAQALIKMVIEQQNQQCHASHTNGLNVNRKQIMKHKCGTLISSCAKTMNEYVQKKDGKGNYLLFEQ